MTKKRRSAGKKRAAPGSRRKDLAETQHKLHAQIGKLEEFIASSPFQESKRKLATRDVIPPPERSRLRSAKKRRLSRKHQQTARQERHRHLLHFFCLFLLLCAMLYWLFGPALSM